MAPKFDAMTPVVDFGASPHHYGAREMRWLLWPALAYKVLLPQRPVSQLNAFQLAVLALCGAGVRSQQEIATRLQLHPELVAAVRDQLGARGFLGEGGAPSPDGLRMLAGEAESQPAAEAGYVLFDAIEQSLWPRLHRGSLPFAEVDAGRLEHTLILLRGTPGNRRKETARIVFPPGVAELATPSARDLQRAARLHARRVRIHAAEAGAAVLQGPARPLEAQERITLLATAPEPVWVAACIFHTAEARQRALLVTDPCGLGVSDLLRSGIQRLVRERVDGFDKMLGKLAGAAWQVDEDELALSLRQGHNQALQRVRQRCGAAIDLLPADVVQGLAAAARRLDEAGNAGAGATRKIEDFTGIAYDAVERLFGWLVSLYADLTLLAALDIDAAPNVPLLASLARQIGFDTPHEAMSLLRVRRSTVLGVIKHGNKDLASQLAACLLAAARHNQHPLRMLAARQPDALALLVRLKRARNPASHAGALVPTMAGANALWEDVFAVLRALVGAAAEPSAAPVAAVGPAGDLHIRMRATAEHMANRCAGIDEWPAVRARLVDMHAAAVQARTLPPDSEFMPSALRDLAVSASTVLEEVMAALSAPALPLRLVGGLSHDRRSNAEMIVRAARLAGFALNPQGGLSTELTHAGFDGIRAAAEARPSSLQASVAALLLAEPHPAAPMLALARRAPEWLLDLGRIVEMRGHGNVGALGVADAEPLEKNTAALVEAALDIMS